MKFEVEQLVRHVGTRDLGIAIEVEADYYGARQALKVYGAERGQAIHSGMVNGIGPTKDGIRDRVKVQWYTDYENRGHTYPSYEDGKNLVLMEDDNEV
jgi:hypothetical protein